MHRSKLRETDARFPDPGEARRKEAFRKYLEEIERLHTEAARSQRFTVFLQEMLGRVHPGFLEEYVRGAEAVLRSPQTTRLLRGRADQLFGNVVLEFESDLRQKAKRDEAHEQLRRYIAILWANEPPDERRPYLAVATDGVRFVTYSPVLQDPTQDLPRGPEDIHLDLLEEADWTTWDAQDVYAWLDRTFLRQRILSPTSENVVRDFGLRSHAFRQTQAALLGLWQEVKALSAFQVVFQEWDRYLRFVYGSDVGSEALFVRHTYLATLAKLMAWMRLAESPSTSPTPQELRRLILGQWFREWGIHNFIEEDFFAWIAREPVWQPVLPLLKRLLGLLHNYHWRGLKEDVFKALYQELVDPETRHDLGEFYTPDWLAHRMVRRILEENPRVSLLDPACGSGTFLYMAVREKRARLGDTGATLHHILQAVQGVDIHPLAVLVARTNYLLALGDVLRKRRGPITLPVYLADTIRLPEWAQQPRLFGEGDRPETRSYRVELAKDVEVSLPELLVSRPALFDRTVDLLQDFARHYQGQDVDFKIFQNFLKQQDESSLSELEEPVLQALFGIARLFKGLLEEGKDSIWAFILKNIYKPLFLQNRFDWVVGNPPWISFRYMEPDYQRFLRRLIVDRYRLVQGKAHLVTQMEVAALFWVRAADLYLKPEGHMAFVLPKSLFSADQHDGLRRYAYHLPGHPGQAVRVEEVWDLEGVEPLFNTSACVLFGKLQNKPRNLEDWLREPFPARVFRGQLARRNASLEEAREVLQEKRLRLALHRVGKRSFWAPGSPITAQSPSPYRDSFRQGATLVPRTFWFVRIREHPELGFNPRRPPLETDPEVIRQAKAPYNQVRLRGQVHARFLYATLLSSDLVPFGYRALRLVLLPILPTEEGRYRLVTPEEAREQGYTGLAQWLEKVEELWTRLRGSKAETLTFLERLDYQHGLISQLDQSFQPCYRVVYNASGTHLAAAVIAPDALKSLEFAVQPQGVVVDHKLYVYETSHSDEAFFLAAILNSAWLNELIKPMQSRGQWGARDIHKKPLEFPIPRYEGQDPRHRALAELGKQATAKVRAWLAQGHAGHLRSSGVLRRRVRDQLQKELTQIDVLVQDLMAGST